MNILIVLWEFIKTVFVTIVELVAGLLKLFPVYEQLSGLKEEIIAAAIGVPVSIITIVCSIPLIIKIVTKIINSLEQ